MSLTLRQSSKGKKRDRDRYEARWKERAQESEITFVVWRGLGNYGGEGRENEADAAPEFPREINTWGSGFLHPEIWFCDAKMAGNHPPRAVRSIHSIWFRCRSPVLRCDDLDCPGVPSSGSAEKTPRSGFKKCPSSFSHVGCTTVCKCATSVASPQRLRGGTVAEVEMVVVPLARDVIHSRLRFYRGLSFSLQ